ncbi:MAG: hypothetical protein AB9903_31540 [Vulcanimicrobiota bacterium]
MKVTIGKTGVAISAVIILILLSLQVSWSAESTATQLVSIRVTPVSTIKVHGNPGLLEAYPTPDGSVYVAKDSSTSYSFFTTERNRKITGSLSQNTPQHTALKVKLHAPSGGSSAGDVQLSASPRDLVTGIATTIGKNLPITYTFLATKNAGTVPLTQYTVTYTITGE